MAWPRFLRKLFGQAGDEAAKEEPPVAVAAAPAEAPATVEALAAEANEAADDDGDDEADEDDEADDEDDDYDDEDDDEDDEPLGTRARHPELEAALRAAPHDPAPHLVYADWLQQQGDPRGELIMLHRTLDGPLDGTEREPLRERARELIRGDADELEGPLPAVYVRFRLGFARHLRIEEELPKGAALARQLDHVAYLLLESMCVSDGEVDDLRVVLAELGREHIAVTTEDTYLPAEGQIAAVTGTGRVETHDGQRWVQIYVEDDFGMESGSHSFLTRTTLASATWSYGCDASLSEDGLTDDPVRTEVFPCAATDDQITCELRFGIENDGGDVVMSFRGTAALPREDTSFEIRLDSCEPHVGPPFEPSPVVDKRAKRGPELVATNDKEGAVIPDHGVFRRGDLVAPGATPRRLADLTPPEPGHLTVSAGGADGTLAAAYSPSWSKTRDASIKKWVSMMVLPDGVPVHRPFTEFISLIQPVSEHRVVVVTTATLHVLDARTGDERWHVELERVEGARENHWQLALVEHGGRLHVLHHDRVTSYALDSGAAEPAWSLPSLATTLRNYGVGMAAFHPQPARAAWMLCASSSHCGMDPVSIVGWRDRDGTAGQVAIAEQGWAKEDEAFGKVAVLPDGRIIAIGTSVWLVEPPAATAICLGTAGGYNRPLQLTQAGDLWRLWNPGAGGWYLEFS